TWLPDAMEGPTPVSALIHAATMVTAGVYLIARTHPIFEQARTVELIAAGTGALTLLVAGLIALVQVDIKRVIAYSTMSQIGYMFLGAGVGAYANGMFHLLTHAFFKALLFMAAGLAIHALAGEQDIRNMRGLGRLMPFTKWCILAGLATIGGWLQWSPRWHPFTDWLEPAARTLPAAVPTNTQEYYTSAATVLAGLAGIAIAWAIYSERTIKIPAAPFWRRTLEHKFYVDELYDAVFYRPGAAIANGLRREFEEPVVLQAGPDLGETTLEAGGFVRRIQTGLLRTYVLFLAAGAAGVVLAFLIAK